MDTPLSTADKIKSLNVEESRAKRLERQQARLRDRGGIFRPANRNNNLFDILVQATHRRSPAKGGGRSRSRSVSPRKKAKKTSNMFLSNPSTSKRKSTLGMKSIAELVEDDIVVQPRTRNPKGKQKQVSETEVGEAEDDLTKFQSRSKKAISEQNKNTAPRRRTKSTTRDLPSERKLASVRAPRTKPKGRRKKTDDDEVEVVEIPPPQKLPTKRTKSKFISHVSTDTERETNSSNTSKYQDENTTAVPGNDADKEKSIKIGKPSKKAKINQPSDIPNELVAPTKSRPRKRKVEYEVLGIDDIPPQKRRVPSKPREAAAGDDDLSEENYALVEPCSTSRALANAINNTQSLANKVEECSVPKKPAKELAALKEAFHSDHQGAGTQLCAVPKAKRKRSQASVEVGDEPEEAEMIAKRPKSAAVKSQKDVLRPKTTIASEGKESPCESKLVKGLTEDSSSKKKPLKSVSSKRKENTVIGKLMRTTSTSKNKTRSKGGPRMPPYVKKKLDARHDIVLSDDEPDPIDFLS